MTAAARRYLLALETSTRRGSVALGELPSQRGDAANAEVLLRDLDPALRHDRDLLPALQSLMAEAGCSNESVAGLVLGRGPGSFTGLRVGSATALGLHRAWEVPVLGLCSLEVTAATLCRHFESVALALDARRGSFFLARYERNPAGFRPRCLMPPELIAGAEIQARVPAGEALWSDLDADALTAFASVERHPDARPGVAGPNADELLRIGLDAWPPPQGPVEEELVPLYLRRSTPEELRDGARSQG